MADDVVVVGPTTFNGQNVTEIDTYTSSNNAVPHTAPVKSYSSFDATGQNFDPHKHEAIMQEEVAGTAPMKVLQTFQSGYKIGDRILRPASVVVSSAES